MKTNCWLMLGVMLATSAVAQDNTNAVCRRDPPRRRPRQAAPAMAPATGDCGAGGKTPSPSNTRNAHAAPARKSRFPNRRSRSFPARRKSPSSNLNVRGQAGLKGEVVAHLDQGDTVTVLSQINLDKHKADEPAQWAKIAYPVERACLGQCQIH